MTPYQLLPALSDEEFAALKADISERGVMVPVEIDENGHVLDGHHRARACKELGIDYPTVVRPGMTEQEKRAHARRANLLRRHLTREQRRQVIADIVADEPHLTDRAVSRIVGCSPSTVAAVRRPPQVSNLDTLGREAALALTDEVRAALASVDEDITAAISAGLSPLAAIGVLTAAFRSMEMESVLDEDIKNSIRLHVLQPRVDALLRLGDAA